MTIAVRLYSGKNAREAAGTALLKLISASVWEDRRELQHLGHYKGFAILSSVSGQEGETPKLYVRGKHTYEANLNTENSLGTIASIEYALRRLDHDAEEEQSAIERMEKALEEYKEQLHRPFEHEERLRELFVKQQEMNRQLDLDKGDSQVVADETPQEERGTDRLVEPVVARRGAR